MFSTHWSFTAYLSVLIALLFIAPASVVIWGASTGIAIGTFSTYVVIMLMFVYVMFADPMKMFANMSPVKRAFHILSFNRGNRSEDA